MNSNILYRLLERPWIYRLSQLLLAPSAEKAIMQKIKQLLAQQPPFQRIVDIGCGPSSLLWRVGLHPVGLDLSFDYTVAFNKSGKLAVTGSAAALPFLDKSFDGVWSIGLLHHLPDGVARGAVSEMIRICRPGGYIVIFDAVLPDPGWRRPVAYILRHLDRGKFMRGEREFGALFPSNRPFIMERITYSFNGLEAIIAYSL
jgi:SAM-dependent methyltransferase